MLGSTRTDSYNLVITMVLEFTSQLNGVAKKMNRSLLEKVRYLLSNASLDRTFWTMTLVYASHLMNCLSRQRQGVKLHWIFGQVELLKTLI